MWDSMRYIDKERFKQIKQKRRGGETLWKIPSRSRCMVAIQSIYRQKEERGEYVKEGFACYYITYYIQRYAV